MTCSGNCKGSCRCSRKTEICLTVGEINKVTIPCPNDQSGLCVLDGHDTDSLVFSCPCCNSEVIRFDDILTLSSCSGCSLEVDLTDYSPLEHLRYSPCKLKYTFRLTSTVGNNNILNKLFLDGSVCLDWNDLGPYIAPEPEPEP